MEALAVADRNLQREALSSELSNNTRAAYQKGWRRFVDYCVEEHIADPISVPPDEVARFFVHLATRPSPQSGVIASMGTVILYKSAVNKKYLEAGKPSPTNHPVVRSTLRGLARLKGSSSRKVGALREYHIEAMLQSCPNTLIGKRDAAIIAVGNQQKWDTLRPERSWVGWRCGELPEGPVVASSPLDGLSLYLLPVP